MHNLSGFVKRLRDIMRNDAGINGDAQRIELALWRKNKGYGRVWYSSFGLNITSAILNKEMARDEGLVNVLASQEDPMTGLEWQQVKATAWMRKGSLIDSVEPIWTIARASYNTSCRSQCRTRPSWRAHGGRRERARTAGEYSRGLRQARSCRSVSTPRWPSSCSPCRCCRLTANAPRMPRGSVLSWSQWGHPLVRTTR